jgi:hypothetical protein
MGSRTQFREPENNLGLRIVDTIKKQWVAFQKPNFDQDLKQRFENVSSSGWTYWSGLLRFEIRRRIVI